MTYNRMLVHLSVLLGFVLMWAFMIQVIRNDWILDPHGWSKLQRQVTDIDNYPRWERVVVDDVVDGDTINAHIGYIYCQWQLTGINAPDSGEASERAIVALKRKLSGKKVLMHRDRAPDDETCYVTLFADGENINQWMLDNGYAVED